MQDAISPVPSTLHDLAGLFRIAARAADHGDPGPLILRHVMGMGRAIQGTLTLGNTLVPTVSCHADGTPAPPLALDHEVVVEASLERRVAWSRAEDGRVHAAVPLILGRERVGLVYMALTAPPDAAMTDALETYGLFAAQLLFQIQTRQLLARTEDSFGQKLEMALGLYDLYSEAAAIALTDRLTGLGSKTYLQQRLTEETEAARRRASPLCLVMVDLDHFKQINDTHGHLIGDQVLAGVGFVIRKQLRLSDVAGRFGGEEFAIVLPATPLDGACVMAERLRRAIGAWSTTTEHGLLQVTASLGVAELAPNAADSVDLLERADQALYRAKRRGRDQVSRDPLSVGA